MGGTSWVSNATPWETFYTYGTTTEQQFQEIISSETTNI